MLKTNWGLNHALELPFSLCLLDCSPFSVFQDPSNNLVFLAEQIIFPQCRTYQIPKCRALAEHFLRWQKSSQREVEVETWEIICSLSSKRGLQISTIDMTVSWRLASFCTGDTSNENTKSFSGQENLIHQSNALSTSQKLTESGEGIERQKRGSLMSSQGSIMDSSYQASSNVARMRPRGSVFVRQDKQNDLSGEMSFYLAGMVAWFVQDVKRSFLNFWEEWIFLYHVSEPNRLQ